MTGRMEGYMPFQYIAPEGKATIGYGHVILPGEKFKQPLLPDEADKLLRTDMEQAERGVNRLVTTHLTQNRFDSLADFAFNAGVGALQTSTLLKKVNLQKHEEVYAQFLRWTYATISGIKVQLNGLVMRRESEATMYAK